MGAQGCNGWQLTHFFAVMWLVFAFVSIKIGHDISASILLTGCVVSMALLEVAKAIRGE